MPNAAYNAATAALEDPRVRAFLWTLRTCEGTANDRGYFTGYGYHYFVSCAVHPGAQDAAGHTASGAYQFLSRSWNTYRAKLQLPDFCQRSQDLAAAAYLIDQGTVTRLQQNDLPGAIYSIREVWPSVAGGSQQQPACSTIARMQATYNAALGSTASSPVLPVPAEAPAWLPTNNAIDLSSYGIGSDTLTVIVAGIVLLAVVSWVTG